MSANEATDADPVAPAASAEKADGTPDLGITVALDSFSGPLDLLLFLVRRSEVDIADIPIGEIADQFIATITGWQDLDLEIGGEFVLMAATLLEIKSRMVAPPTEEAEEGVSEEEKELYDPRKGLIGRLLAYRRFKEVAQALTTLEHAQNLRAARHYREQVPEDPAEADALDLENAEPGYLAKLWFTIQRRITGLGPRTVVKDSEPIEVRIAKLVEQIQATGEIRLFQIFALEPQRMSRVTTVMAMLESTRQRFITVEQPEQYGDVDLRFRPEDKRAVIRFEFPPLPEEKKRKRRPPLATWHQTVETAGDEDAPPPAEDSTETDEQRFLRELEEACRLEEVLSRGGNLELGFAEYWARKRGLPWPPPAPELPVQQAIPLAAAPAVAGEAPAAASATAAPVVAAGEQKAAAPAASDGEAPKVAAVESQAQAVAATGEAPAPAVSPATTAGDQPTTAAAAETPSAAADPNAAPLIITAGANGDASATTATAMANALTIEVPATGDAGTTVSTIIGNAHAPLTIEVPATDAGSTVSTTLGNAPLTVEIPATGDIGSTVSTSFGHAPLTVEIIPDGAGGTVRTAFGQAPLIIDPHPADGSGATVNTTYGGGNLVIENNPADGSGATVRTTHSGGNPAATSDPARVTGIDLGDLITIGAAAATGDIGAITVDIPSPTAEDSGQATERLGHGQVYREPAAAEPPVPGARDDRSLIIDVDPVDPAGATVTMSLAGEGGVVLVDPGEALSTRMAAIIGPAGEAPPVRPDELITLTPENTPILGEAVIADPGGQLLDAVLVDPGPDAMASQRMRALATDLGPAIAPANADHTPGGIAAITVDAPNPVIASSGDLSVAATSDHTPIGAITVGGPDDGAGDTVQTTLGKIHADTQDERAGLLTITLPPNEAAGDTVQTTLGKNASEADASERIAAYTASRAGMQTMIVSTDEASGASADRAAMDTISVSTDEASGAKTERAAMDTLIVSTDEATGAAADRSALDTLIVSPNQASGGTLDTIIAQDAADVNRRAAMLTISLPPGEAAGDTVQTTLGKAHDDPADAAKNPALANVNLHTFEHVGNLRIHVDADDDRAAMQTITLSPNQASGGTMDTIIANDGEAAAAQTDRSAMETMIVSSNQASGGTLDTIIVSTGTNDALAGQTDRSAMETMIVSSNQASGGTLDTIIVNPDHDAAAADRAGMLTITLPPGEAAGGTVQTRSGGTTLGVAPGDDGDEVGVAPITVEMPAVDSRAATATTTDDIPAVARAHPITTVEVDLPVDPRAATASLPTPTAPAPPSGRTPPPGHVGSSSSRMVVGGGNPPTTSRRATAVTRRVLVNVPFAPAPPPTHRNDPVILVFVIAVLGLLAWLGWWFVNHGNHAQRPDLGGGGHGSATGGGSTGGSAGNGAGNSGHGGGMITGGGGAPTPGSVATGMVIGTTRLGGTIGTTINPVRSSGAVGTATLGLSGSAVGTARSATTVGSPQLSLTGSTVGTPTAATVTSGHPGTF